MSTLKSSLLSRWLRQIVILVCAGLCLLAGWRGSANAAHSVWPSSWANPWSSWGRLNANPLNLKAFAVAQTFTVTSLADDGTTGTLRWAIGQANTTPGADTIEFQAGLTGTITLTTTAGGTLTLSDTSGATTINGPTSGGGITVSGGNAVRVFFINDRVTANLNNLTISNGSVASFLNYLQYGAGITSNGVLTVTNCIITNNVAAGAGGAGIASGGANASLNLVNSTVTNNQGSDGAGISINSHPFTFINSTISNNNGTGNAAGFYNRYGTGTIIGCTFSGNRSYVTGGLTNEGDITIINSTFSGNRADIPRGIFGGNGGGLINQGPAMRIYNCTITGNVGIEGGGIQTQGDFHLVMKNSIVAGNVSTFGGSSPYDLRFTGSDGFNDPVLGASTYNLIGSVTNSGGLTNGVNGNIVGNNGSGTVTLANILDTTLANNGGPTLTHALATNSPAINVGSNVTTLNGAINNSTTTITVTNAGAFPGGIGLVIQIDSEQMIVNSVSGNQLTVTRGANSTTAAAHNNAAGVNPAFDQRGTGNPRLSGAAVDMGAIEKVVTTPPMIANCPPASQTVNADPGLCTASVSFAPTTTGAPTPTVVCKIGATTITSPYNFPVGTSNVICTASNGVMPDATCNFSVTVVDNQKPQLTCPGNQTATATSAAGASVNYTVPTATDNCAMAPVTCMPTAGTTFPIGTTTVTCTAVDGALNAESCNFTVGVACPTITVSPTTPTLPDGTIGAAYNASFTQSGAFSSAVAFTVSAGSLPPGLNLTTAGLLSGTPTQLGTYNFTITATNAAVCTGSRAYSLSISCPTITLNPASPTLPAATAGTAYSANFTQTGAFAGSAAFSVTAGTLPSGLTLSPAGALTGTPTQTGTFNFTVSATDTYTCAGNRAYSLTVNCSTLTVAPSTLTAGQAGVVLNQALTASGGVAPYSFSLAVGSTLPAGLTLGANGLLSGTPTIAGSTTFTVIATDVNGCTGNRVYTLDILCPVISATPAGLPNAVIGTAYSQTLTGSGGVGSYTFALRGGSSLPAGLNLVGNTITGTPTALGTTSFIIDVTDTGSSFNAVNCAGSRSYSITVSCPTVTLSPTSLPNGATGTAYNQTLSGLPSGTSYSFAVTTGVLPTGLTLSSSGALTGTPTAAGNFTFIVTATGWGGCSGTQSYNLTVTNTCATITLSPTTLPAGNAGSAYTQTLSASPAASYSFTVTGGTLPTGLTLNSSTGVLSGTPTSTGSFNFTVTATGAGGCTGTASYTVTITCPTYAFSPASLSGASAGIAYSRTVTVTPAGSYTFSLQTGSLPPGISLNAATGVLSGMATATGTYNFTIKATGAGGCTGSKAYSIVVSCPTITLTPTTMPGGPVGTVYSQSLTVTPAGTYSFSKQSGTLPPGLTLNTASGVLSGTPTTAGTYSFTLKATGFGTCSGMRTYSVTITATCPTITLPASLSAGVVGASYFGDLAGLTPTGSYTLSLLSGSLPPGLVLDDLFLALLGTPTTAGTYNFTVKATRADGCSGTQAYSVVIASAGVALALWGDYNGDGLADPVMWSAASGEWRILLNGQTEAQAKIWGGAGDVSLLGDYDADGKTDVAIYRPSSGYWYILGSRTGAASVKQWGASADVPVPGDYDGDGQTDFAVWRPSDGNWYISYGAANVVPAYTVISWGSGAAQYDDVPVPGDYDGDRKTDLAVFRRTTGEWLIKLSSTQELQVTRWGLGTDIPVVADYDGDGRSDLAVWRGQESNWYILHSSDQNWHIVSWGLASAPYHDLAVPADYDGDGKADVTVWRTADDVWYIQASRDGAVLTKTGGIAGAQPVRARQR